METLQLIDNPDKSRFEAEIEGHLAVVEYIRQQDRIYLTHTEVPQALGGKGYGSKLIETVLEQIELEGLRLIALCPFVRAYLQRHPEWNRLLDPSN
ncbi:MAG: N-acetyltransferase [Phaeodactylibacter sp.]|nr:N-acetyltransferase [Phaeodactylibacter sp.]